MAHKKLEHTCVAWIEHLDSFGNDCPQSPVASKGTPGDAKCVTEIPWGQK